MKNTIKISVICTFVIVVNACKKDNNGLVLQAHDQNQMMAIMHQMMARMDTVKLTKDPDNDFALMMRMAPPRGN